MATVATLALLLTGCKANVINKLPIPSAKSDTESELVKAMGSADQRVQVEQGWVVLTAAKSGAREVGLVRDGQVVGERQQIAENADEATLTKDGDLIVVETKKEKAPQFTAFEAGASGLVSVDYYAKKAPDPEVKKGPYIVVNKHLNVLWQYQDGKLVKAYRVATGRQTESPAPTWTDYKTNFFTPEGNFTLTNFVKNPPFNALKPGDKSFSGGESDNPLGTRWMGFSVLPDDNAWLWGIHGTSHPEQIGTWASDGCIRMYTPQVEELFDQLSGKNVSLKVVGK